METAKEVCYLLMHDTTLLLTLGMVPSINDSQSLVNFLGNSFTKFNYLLKPTALVMLMVLTMSTL